MTADGLLLVRDTLYSIRVLHRQTGDLVNNISSMCNHESVRVNKHPRHADYVLECCPTCRVVRAYNIKTSDYFFMYSCSTFTATFARMFDGPAKSLFVVDSDCTLFKLVWDKDQSPEEEPKSVSAAAILLGTTKELLSLCYIEHHDLLLCTVKGGKIIYEYSVVALTLESGTIIWKMCGEVEGQVIKPFAITCDPEGNAYVSDRNSNRILKIDSLTGEVMSILLVEEEEEQIRSMCWSNTKPNLTLRTKSQISTYSIDQ